MELVTQNVLHLQRILLIVAHPDDESIGAGLLLQRNPQVHVVFCTSGAQNNPSTWRRFGSHWRYARIREREAQTALLLAGNTQYTFLRFPDGKLYRSLPKVYRSLRSVVDRWKPACIVTHAYEGGHQDHEVCSFLSGRISAASGIPVQEMPLYHLDVTTGRLIYQTFLHEADNTQILEPAPAELQTKQKMFAAHQSQRSVLKDFSASCELFRPQTNYNYLQPAIPGMSKMAVTDLTTKRLIAAFRVFASPTEGEPL